MPLASLEAAMDIARTFEATKAHVAQLRATGPLQVHAVAAKRTSSSHPPCSRCGTIAWIKVGGMPCNGTELHPQSVHHTVHPQIMSWQESSDLSLKVSPHVRRGARLRKKKEEERNGDGRHGYKMATVAMVIISDGRHGYKMATDA